MNATRAKVESYKALSAKYPVHLEHIYENIELQAYTGHTSVIYSLHDTTLDQVKTLVKCLRLGSYEVYVMRKTESEVDLDIRWL